MKFVKYLTLSLVLFLLCIQSVYSQATGEEPTTKKPGFFSRLFGKSGTTTTSTTTTSTTSTTTTTPRPKNVPTPPQQPSVSPAAGRRNPMSQPNLAPLSPYPRPQQQPSGVSLSYGPTVPGKQSPSSGNVPLAPIATSTAKPTPTPASPSSTIPKAPLATGEDFSGFGDSKKSSTPSPSSTPPTSTRNPAVKEDFPPLPPPRRPSIKEDFPALPARPASPGGASSTTSVPSVWSTTPSAHGNRAPTVPHALTSTTTVSPGSTTTEKSLASDDEIRTLTENLFNKEVNSQQKLITVNIQGKTRSIDTTDEAPQPLLQVDNKALEVPTIATMKALFNNYEIDTLVNEHYTPLERKEENEFVDAVMGTNVMRQAMQFLQTKGIVSPDPKTHRDLVKSLWFTPYSRGQGKIGSSGFEHVFVTEVKDRTIIGLHNWVYFNEEEQSGRLDYKGYLNKLDLGNKGSVVKLRFTHNGLSKPVNTLFIGTSPELELALYTVCFQLRPDKLCPVSLAGNKFGIQTYTWRYRGKNLIGSAYPEI